MSGLINSAGSRSGVIGTTELDYEEGEWNPTVLSSGGGTWTLGSSGDTGWYTKIGQLVTIGGMIVITSVTNPHSGNLSFTLPFTPGDSDGDGDYTFGNVYIANHGGDWGSDRIDIFIYSASNGNLHKTSPTGAGAYIDTGDVDEAWQFGFSMSYHTDV